MSSVFLSYRHETDAHRAAVRGLAERLEAAGIDVVFDAFAHERQFHGGGPDEGWPRWSRKQAGSDAHRVLIVASAGWFRCYQGTQAPGEGLGAAAEAAVIEQRLYNSAGIARDIRIVGFAPLGRANLPVELQRYHHFEFPRDEPDLLRWLHASEPATPAPAPVPAWPIAPPVLDWPLCDHHHVRDAFAQLLTATSPYKAVFLQGPSGRGKTSVTEHLLGNALRLPGISCGRLDLKGGIHLQPALMRFASQLGVRSPAGPGITEGLVELHGSLLARSQPTVIILDTYEAADGEVQDWVCNSLLTSLISPAVKHLRVVIAGQSSPRRRLAAWASEALGPLDLEAPSESDWYAYAQRNRPELTRDFVHQLYSLCGRRSALLAQLLGPPHEG